MSEVAVPRKAATVIVVRPNASSGFEVLLTRRPPEMQFLGGFLVFPGGGVEEGDWSDRMLARCRGLTPVEAQKILATEMSPQMSLGHWVAAIRELFEETGIHYFVAETGESRGGAQATQSEILGKKRKALTEGWLDLLRLLETEDLFCDVSRLTYLFHRITPEKHSVRFDTRFYLAALPETQTPLNSSEEVAESLWITPQAAVNRSEDGELPMMPPTIIALRSLASHGSWQELRAAYQLS